MTTKRQPTKSKKIKADLLKPVDIAFLEEHSGLVADCHGKDYDALDNRCTLCHDSESCMIKFQDKVKKDKKLFEKQQNFLDNVSFKALDENKESIAASIIKKGISLNSFAKQVMSASGMKDKKTVLLWIARFMKEYDLDKETRNGKEFIC